MKILIIEDDVATIEAIRLCLEIHRSNISVTFTPKGIEGIQLLRRESPDVVILDLGLPDLDGISVLEQVRQFSQVPVLIVSARDTQHSIVRALEIGAEDYIVKPFNYQDLLKRLDNVTGCSRVTLSEVGQGSLKGGNLEIDLDVRRVVVAGNSVELTDIEWSLLIHLLQNAGRMVPLDCLVRDIWRDNTGDASILRSTVSRLRMKLGDAPYSPSIIFSEHGAGYRFVMPK